MASVAGIRTGRRQPIPMALEDGSEVPLSWEHITFAPTGVGPLCGDMVVDATITETFCGEDNGTITINSVDNSNNGNTPIISYSWNDDLYTSQNISVCPVLNAGL